MKVFSAGLIAICRIITLEAQIVVDIQMKYGILFSKFSPFSSRQFSHGLSG
jgi:hypothetical protein